MEQSDRVLCFPTPFFFAKIFQEQLIKWMRSSNTKITKLIRVPFLTLAPHSLPRRLDFSSALLVTLFFWLVQKTTTLFVVHKLQAERNGVLPLFLFTYLLIIFELTDDK
jgi:hypothetical protein